MKTTHTPTPWKYVEDKSLGDREFGKGETMDGKNTPFSSIKREDAAFIVRAVNSHEELLFALKQLLEMVEDRPRHKYEVPGTVGDREKLAHKAIAKAEGE